LQQPVPRRHTLSYLAAAAEIAVLMSLWGGLLGALAGPSATGIAEEIASNPEKRRPPRS
jgi:hypothetical protein